MTTPVTLPGQIDAGTALQLQLKALESQMKSRQTEIAGLTKQINTLKAKKNPSAADKSSLGAAQARLKRVQAQLATATQSHTVKQNQYYENTGQYDKLLSGDNRNAYMALSAMFEQYGLGSLASKIYDFIKNGYGSDVISLMLQDSPEYKKRFAANEARRKAGMPVLSPAEYISVENSYRQIMRQSGLPQGFYDSADDFTSWISGDMSPTELQGRVDLATQATALANPAYKSALKQMGLSDGDLTAYFLDQNRALPLIQKAAATAAIGAEALQRGLAFDPQYAEELATSGVSRDTAASGYAKIADEFSNLGTLAQVYGGQWTQRMAEEDAFIGGTSATKQKERLASSEKGAFSGSTGGASSGLAQRGGAR